MNNIKIIENIEEIPENIIKKLNERNLTVILENNSLELINIFLKNNNKNIYLDNNYKININIEENNFDLFKFLIDCIEKAFNIILKSSEKYQELFDNIYLWNLSISENIFFNYPFTISNVIFIPIDYINICFNKNNIIEFIKTLIHEKLHIGQRYNEIIWEKYINEIDSKWTKINKQNELFNVIENNILNNSNALISNQFQFISNPDTYYDNFKYIYNYHNKMYYGHYVYNKITKLINKKYFIINYDKISNNYKILNTNKIFNEEHPYEVYAYKISEELIKIYQ